MRHQLAIRIDAENPVHHLWKNHGTWWINYTLHTDGQRVRRVRRSLNTSSIAEACGLRDAIFLALSCEPKDGTVEEARPRHEKGGLR
jgi:hypothetical protein